MRNSQPEGGCVVAALVTEAYMDANLPEEAMWARVTVLREDPPTGQDAQIDYG